MKKRDKRSVARRFIHSYLSSLISITLVLVLAGMGGLVLINAAGMKDYFKENLKLSVIYDMSINEERAVKLTEEIASFRFVREVEYISQERGTQEMKGVLGEDFLDVFDFNPIPISADIYLKPQYVSPDSLKFIEAELLLNNGIREVVWERSLIEVIDDNMESIGAVLLTIIALLLFISFFLINNTVRLNVFSKRFVIHTMKLVGAKRSFIRRPFIYHGVVQGLLSGIFAISILYGMLYILKRDFEQIYDFLDPNYILYLSIGLLLSGIVICLISTVLILNKMLSLPADDLYY